MNGGSGLFYLTENRMYAFIKALPILVGLETHNLGKKKESRQKQLYYRLARADFQIRSFSSRSVVVRRFNDFSRNFSPLSEYGQQTQVCFGLLEISELRLLNDNFKGCL